MKDVYKVTVWIIIAVLLIFFAIYNFFTYEDFFKSSFATCISIGVVIYISYFLTQKQNDKRKQKEILLKILESIQQFTMDRSSYQIDTADAMNSINSRKRVVSNKILILINVAKRFGIEKETAFIKDRFHEYEDLIGNHFGDLDYIIKSQKELRRPLELIDSKLSELMLKLYE